MSELSDAWNAMTTIDEAVGETIKLPIGVVVSLGELIRPRAFETDYGMIWLPAGSTSVIEVERITTHYGVAVLSVRSSWEGNDGRGTELQIAISKGGRSIRVFDDEGQLVRGGTK